MKPWQILLLAFGVLIVAVMSFMLGSRVPSKVPFAPAKVPGLANISSCKAVLESVSKNLGREAYVSPCTDASTQAVGALFGSENFNKKQSGALTLDGIAHLSISEFDLSIKSGREGLKKLLENGELGQKAYKVADNVTVTIYGGPYMFQGMGRTPTGQSTLIEWKITPEMAAWLDLASSIEIEQHRETLKKELAKAAGVKLD